MANMREIYRYQHEVEAKYITCPTSNVGDLAAVYTDFASDVMI